MGSTHSYALDRDTPPTDWRAVAIVIVFHVMLVAIALMSPAHGLHLFRSQPALIVRVIDAVSATHVKESKISHRTPAAAAPKPHPAQSRTVSENARRLQPIAQVVPEARDSAESDRAAIATGAFASDIAGTGATDSHSKGSGVTNGPRFRPPRVMHRLMPYYPRDAFMAHQEGSVDVIVDIRPDGTLAEAHVYQSSGATALDQAAVAGVLKWSFRAAERNGVATQAQAIVTIDWIIGSAVMEHFAQPALSSDWPREDIVKKLQCLYGPQPDLCKSMNDQRRHHP